jgi:hypothetical protein
MTTLLGDDELARIKAECLDVVLDVGAAPYFDIRAIYVVIQEHVLSSTIAPTTSATAVTTAGPTTLTLASVSGLASGSRVVVDVDSSREVVTVRAVVGSTISVICRRLHSGTYPVEVESPLTIVRGLLADLAALDDQEQDATASAGLKRVDEVEWETGAGASISDRLLARRDALRDRLARACGISHILAAGRSLARGSSSFEVY